jgi:protoheme IX farnesyltransferase
MCVVMAVGGAGLAAHTGDAILGDLGIRGILALVLGTALSVSSANSFNMVIERDGDRHMVRTRSRPLATGRMPVWVALAFGVLTGVGSLLVLGLAVNALTAALSLLALLGYVLVYTPMKRKTWVSLIVGAFPGAMPPLMGWTAATGEISAPGVILFLILLVWQIPHFIAISVYRLRDYTAAGIKTVPGELGEESARIHALLWTMLLVPVSLLLVPIGAAGFFYFAIAGALGAWFFVICVRGFEPKSGTAWARTFFLSSIVYLPALTLGLVLDAYLG